MGFFKKNKFWIANFLLAAALIGVYFYATAALQEAMDKRTSAINALESSVVAVTKVSGEEGVTAHPNETTEVGMQAKLDTLSDSVLAAWKLRYEAQRKIMDWPTEILHGPIGKEFIRQFDRYQPPETLPADEKGQSTKIKPLLEYYQIQIPSQMKNIAAIIKSDWKYQEQLDRLAYQQDKKKESGDSAEGDAGGDDSEDQNKDPKPAPRLPEDRRQIVMWSKQNQDLWYEKLTQFRGRDDNEFPTELPSPSQVYMLQQDLWLLEAMFEIIRMVNARMDDDGQPMMGPDGRPKMVLANDLAAIKRIDHVVFGREALSHLGEIYELQDAPTESGGRGGPVIGPRGDGSGSTESDAGLTYRGQPAFHGRYVNANFEPIEADTIRTILSDKTMPADNLELMVAKRVPVRLAVQMDERRIPDFLAASANSPFAFEVWQVRINRHDPKEEIKLRGREGPDQNTGQGGGRSDGGRGPSNIGGVGGIGGLGGGGELGGQGGIGSASGPDHVALRRDYDVGVEFYGVIKIYNPVNESLLKGEANPAATP